MVIKTQRMPDGGPGRLARVMRRLWMTTILAACTSADEPAPTCEDACAAEGKLCEAGSCVDPWRFGSPVFSRCEDESRATPESLAEKAAI